MQLLNTEKALPILLLQVNEIVRLVFQFYYYCCTRKGNSRTKHAVLNQLLLLC